jgi:protein-tyrosine-phosphatase
MTGGESVKIDKYYLDSIGIRFETEEETQAFAEIVQSELEIRIGTEIASRLSDEQLDEFDMCIESDDAREWLEENCPDFRDIVDNETERMEEELISNISMIPGVVGISDDEIPY